MFEEFDLSPRAAAVFFVVAGAPPVVGDRLARLLGACACRPLNGLAPFYSRIADVGFRQGDFRGYEAFFDVKFEIMAGRIHSLGGWKGPRGT